MTTPPPDLPDAQAGEPRARPVQAPSAAARAHGSPADAGEARLVAEARALGLALATRGWMAVTAESCTGGMIARALTETAGSSAWVDRGFVTYSNDAKRELLGVRAETLAEHGAVSEATAREMAEGALAGSRARLALSVTGIAGPGGAVVGKPVGTVCFGWALRPVDGSEPSSRTETLHLPGDRAAVRLAAARHAVGQALRMVEQLRPNPDDSAKS